MNLSARGTKLEASRLPTSPLLHRRPLAVARRSAGSSPPRSIRPPPVLLGRLRFLANRPHRVPRRLRQSEFRTGMEGARETSPESTTSGGDGFVYVSGVEIAGAEGSGTDPVAERGISGGGARGEHAILPEEAVGDGFDEEFEDSEVGLEEMMEEPKRVLPEELAKGVVVLECESSAEGGSCDVYLVGTAHVSQESCREVEAIIRCLKPQVVFLELCASRVAILTPQNLKVPTMNEMIDMWKRKDSNIFGILYSFFLAKVASKLEVFPGAEFRVAFEEARSFGAKVILGDRPVQITLRRTWGRMTLWHKAKFLSYMIFQSMFLPSSEDLNKLLKDLDDGDMLTLLIQEMSKAFPTLMETLLIERDMYMSSKLFKVASEHSSVVAVVGRGHLAGIKKHWKQPLQINHLLEVPKRNPHSTTMKILASLGVAATGAAIISGIYLACRRSK